MLRYSALALLAGLQKRKVVPRLEFESNQLYFNLKLKLFLYSVVPLSLSLAWGVLVVWPTFVRPLSEYV